MVSRYSINSSLILLLTTATTLAQTTWYVDDANCPGPGTGAQGDPYCKIQDGIDAAQNGDTVLVADGVYTGLGNKNLSFDGKAITVQSANGPDNSMIDCERSGRGFLFINGETQSSALEGIGILDGHVATSGGAILSINSAPTIRNCRMINCNAESNGGGLYCLNASPMIESCQIVGNIASSGGGLFSEGLASFPEVIDCQILQNGATVKGGGIGSRVGTLSITNSVIQANESGEKGGGLHIVEGTLSMVGCLVFRN